MPCVHRPMKVGLLRFVYHLIASLKRTGEDIIIHRTDGLERPPPEGPSVRYNGFVSSLMAVSASMCRSSLLGKFRVIMRYIVR
jgi:hypothetical protein